MGRRHAGHAERHLHLLDDLFLARPALLLAQRLAALVEPLQRRLDLRRRHHAPVHAAVRVWYNPDQRSQRFTVLSMIASVLPSLVIARLFDVPLAGSLGLFMALTGLFLFSAIALGVLVAAFTRTLQQALLLAFFGLFPLLFLSGTLAPVESMPEVLQRAAHLSPLRHYMDVILGVFLKGTGLPELWPQALALLAIGAALFTTARAVFRREFG